MTEWHDQVWRALRRVPRGRVVTYRTLARWAGRPRAYRAVGNILHRNPDRRHFSCHRVVQSSGLIGGYVLGVKRKIIKLKHEGVRFASAQKIAPASILYE